MGSCITKMKGALLCCFLLLAVCLVNARNPKDKYGILFVHEIVANYDTGTVQIEDSFVEDRTLRIDLIEEWSGDGVRSEGIFFNDGDVILADDFVVNPPTVFPNRVNANGGTYADGGLEDFSSFTVEDDTGRTSVRGVIYVEGGIFTPAGGNGETTIRDADLNANGGINVNDGSFTVGPDGALFTASTLNVQGTIFLGDNSTQDRFVQRVYTADQIGGNTIISAQDGTSSGGNLLIVPGSATDCEDPDGDAFTSCSDGDIFLGRQTNDNIEVTRPVVSGAGAQTTYNGQDSITGDGGGGDLILIPGQASAGNHGKILLGTDSSSTAAAFPIDIQRPDLLTGNGGATVIQGQNTQSGPAGDLYIVSGQSPGAGAPLYLIPGDANQDFGNNEEQGSIIFGTSMAADLMITRSPSSGSGGDTLLEGQVAASEDAGGDLYIAAGDSNGNGNGGDLVLRPGFTPYTPGQFGVPQGQIFLGDQVDDLLITREARDGGGLDTVIVGQTGQASQGGDLFFYSGEGATSGGDVTVRGGNSPIDNTLSFAVGGSVILQSSDAAIDGGSIFILAGEDTQAAGANGDITITTGDAASATSVAGDIRFNAGSGDSLGDFVIDGDDDDATTPITSTLTFDTTPIIIDNSYFEIQEDSENVVFRADPTSILSYNGKTLIRSVSDYIVPAVPTTNIAPANDPLLTDTAYRLNQLQNSLEILINALSQCQHGLLETVDEFGIPDSCEAYVPSFTPALP